MAHYLRSAQREGRVMTMPDQVPREQHDEEDDGPEFNEPGEG
jgi:hypothetical protein